LSDGREFRVLCVMDDFSRECLATVFDNSLSGIRVARELDAIAITRGYHCIVVSDYGTELTSNAILGWQQETLVEWHYIAPPASPCKTASMNHSTVVCVTSA
jgi:putative transposase